MEEDPNLEGHAQEDAQVRALKTRALLAFSITTLCLAVIATAVWIIPVTLDARNLENARDNLRHSLRAEGDRIGQASLEYSYWNDAVEKLIYEQDSAWGDAEVGSYLHETYGITTISAQDRNGNRQYAYTAKDSFVPPIWDRSQATLEQVRKEVIASDPSSPQHTHTYTMIDGELVLVAASPFVAYEPTRLDTSRLHGILFLLRKVDESTLSEWSERFELTGLSVAPITPGGSQTDDHGASLVVTDMAGNPVSRLEWQPVHAGRNMLARAAPWGVSLAIVWLVAATVMVMNLRKLVRLARSNLSELDLQKQKLFRQAMFDEVSNLHNRNYLISRLEEELPRIRRTGTSSIFIFLDLDGFKMVNDTMGHSVGDDLLRQVGARLVNGVRSEDVVCRFGGDEFCILITGLNPESVGNIREVAAKISHQVISELERPFDVDNKPVNIGTSAGIVVIPDDTTDIEDILRFGDLAMYRAKLVSGNHFIHYQQDFLHDINYRNAIRHKLETAMPKNEFGIDYQPIHEIGQRRIVGFEALARWDSEDLGLIRPSQFIAIAEESDTIIRLGRWIIDEALRNARSLKELAGEACFIAINVSAKQLADPDFCEYLEERMDFYGVAPDDVHLELTESYQFRQEMGGLETLREIRAKGVHLTLDDFGTGYASLSYLQQYPLSTVKIDHGFVANAISDVKMEGIIRAVVQMANSLGIRVIAEGVETEEHEQALIAFGCHWAQGFYYSEPGSLESLQRAWQAPAVET